MLISLQYARAIAALLVVYAHLQGFEFFKPLTFGEFGGMGVDIFFVISGFIMWETSSDQSPRNFALRRIARIVPAYWFYTSLLIVLAVVLPQVTPRIQLDATAVICSYLFIPYTNHLGQTNPILLQGWTLNFEMYFYLIFALSLFARSRTMRVWLIAAFFVATSAAGYFVDKGNAVLATYTSAMPLEFVFGIFISILSRKWTFGIPVRMAALFVGAAGLLGAEIFAPGAEPRFLVLGLPAALFLFGMMGLEPAARRRPSRFLSVTGDASYSLYLSHPFVLSGVAVLFKVVNAKVIALTNVPGALATGIVAILLAVAFAHLSFILIEKPAGRFLNALFRDRRRDMPSSKLAGREV